MQSTSSIYKSIVEAAKAADSSYAVENKIEIYSADGWSLVGSYGEDTLISGNIIGELFETASVGGAKSRQQKVTMYAPDEEIPRMAQIKPYFRISFDGEVSEWISKGEFYVDTRHLDKESGILDLHCYDAMLKTEQIYSPDASGTWPRSMKAVVDDICDLIGVPLDINTSISSEYMCQLDTTLTMRDYLGYIAAAHAGVFAINDLGKMVLLPLAITTSVEDIGIQVQELNTSPDFQGIGKIEIYATPELYFAYPEDATGRTLSFDCPWGSEAMAQDIYNKLKGYVYKPYEATGAIVSPAVELGDGLKIDGAVRGVYKQELVFGRLSACNISAPSDEELDHEYAYSSKEKRIARQVSKLTSELRVTAESIQGLVEDVEGNRAEFEQAAQALTARVESAEGMASEAQQTANGFSQRITNAEGNIAEIKFSLEGVVYTSSLADGTTVINGGCITTGTIDANKVNITNLTVTNGNITSLDVGKLTVGGKAISADNPWDTAYHRNVWVAEGTSGGGKITLDGVAAGYAQLSPDGVVLIYGSDTSTSTITASWKEIIEVAKGGGTATAVFG